VQNGVIRRAPTNVHTWPFAAGSLCSTAGDLLTWVNALHGGKVLSPESYREMITPATLNDGTPLRYGMGIGVGKDSRGVTYIGHGGSVGGFTAEAGWYPDAQLAVVVLTNSGGSIDAGDVAGELAAALLPSEAPAVAPFTGDAAPLVGHLQGTGTRSRHGHPGDAGTPGDCGLGQWRIAPPPSLGRGDDVPSGQQHPDLPRRRPAPLGQLGVYGSEEAVEGQLVKAFFAQLVCLTVYRKGAREGARRLAA
jgi:hypothetical protein